MLKCYLAQRRDVRSPREFFYKSVLYSESVLGATYMNPSDFHSVALTFQRPQEESGRPTIHEPLVDRHAFLLLLIETGLSRLHLDRVENHWNPEGHNPITAEEEPLLEAFGSLQVRRYIDSRKEDESVGGPSLGSKSRGKTFAEEQRDLKKRKARISVQDAFRVCAEKILSDVAPRPRDQPSRREWLQGLAGGAGALLRVRCGRCRASQALTLRGRRGRRRDSGGCSWARPRGLGLG
jgi:hypothetical protein